MSASFAKMLNETLKMMEAKIQQANQQWEKDNDGVVLKNFENTQLK